MALEERRQWQARLAPDGRVISPLRLGDPRPPQPIAQALSAFERPGRPARTMPPPPMTTVEDSAAVAGVIDDVATSPLTVTSVQPDAPSIVDQTSTELATQVIAQPNVPVTYDGAPRQDGRRVVRRRVVHTTELPELPPSSPSLASLFAARVGAAPVEPPPPVVDELRASVAALQSQVDALEGLVADLLRRDADARSAPAMRDGFVVGPDGRLIDPMCLPTLPQIVPTLHP